MSTTDDALKQFLTTVSALPKNPTTLQLRNSLQQSAITALAIQNPPPPPPTPVDNAPVTKISLSAASGVAPLAVVADLSASSDTDATPIASYHIVWGDGSTSDAAAASPKVSHTYTTPGTYVVTATAKDTAGLVSTPATTGIVITAPAPAPPTPTMPDLVPTVIKITPASPAAGASVNAQVTFRNDGVAIPPGTNIGVGIMVDGVQVSWASNWVDGLAQGASMTVDTGSSMGAGAFTLAAGSHVVQGYVDDVNRIIEASETNNKVEMTVVVGGGIVTPPPVDPPAPPPTGSGFKVSGGKILDPNGKVFIPIGANVGYQGSFDWKGVAEGNSASAVNDWKWNSIRVNFLSYGKDWGWCPDPYAKVDQIVTEYTAKGIVVCIASSDLQMAGDVAGVRDRVHADYANFATKYKNNPLVWLEPYTEPPLGDQAYIDEMKVIIGIIRGAGYTNPIVIDAVGAAPDIGGWAGLPLLKDSLPQMGDANLIGSIHDYAGEQDAAALTAHFAAIRAAGFAVNIGEFGWTIDGTSTAGNYASNHAAGLSVFSAAPPAGVGMWVWHGTHGDMFSLRSDGGPFYGTAPRSELGDKLYAVTHP